MTTGLALLLVREAIFLTLVVTGILVIPSFVVGLIVSIFQATTQIQEQTLTFVPKMIITALMIAIFGNFIINQFVQFFVQNINQFSKI